MITIVQKAEYKVIKRQIIRYNCDKCGAILDKNNHKQIYYSNGTKHVCKYKKECNPFFRTPRAK